VASSADGDKVGVVGGLDVHLLFQPLVRQPTIREGDDPVHDCRRVEELGITADDAVGLGHLSPRMSRNTRTTPW
jgi:hypothetical protein